MDAANSIKACRGWIPLLTTAAFLMSGGAAIAQESAAGDPCGAGIAKGAIRQANSAGNGIMLVCDGDFWQTVLGYTSDGDVTGIGKDTCNDGEVLTYFAAGPFWGCGAGGGSGSSLFERSGTVIRPNSAAVTLSTDDFVFGSHSLDDLAGADDDSRMYFDKSKGAFRAGYNSTTSWDASTANVGIASMAFGGASRASGERSMAWGSATASAFNATAWGSGATANMDYSTAWGESTTSSGRLATAWGAETIASGAGATAWGGYYDGPDYISGGTAVGIASTAWGIGTHAGSFLETSLGRYPLNTAGTTGSWVATDTLFEIGVGPSTGARANAVTVLKNGKVAIGNITPNVALDVDGDIEYTGTIADVSDSRSKTNIQSLSPERGDAIAALKPVSFEMKDREGRRELGFIAQDVEQVFPELVQTSDSGTKSMNYIGLIAPMVKAIQQLQADNEALKAKVDVMTCDKQGTEAAEQPAAPHSLND